MIEFTGNELTKVDGINIEYTDKQNIILEMSNGCNMACKYCFEAESALRPIRNINISVVKTALDKIIIQHAQEYNITFFGGEPLLNQHVIFETIEYANKKSKEIGCYIRYYIITNGTLINQQIIDTFNKNNVHIFFSYDGCSEFHNEYRISKNGTPTFSLITKNIHLFAESRSDYLNKSNLAIRMTVTRDFIPKLVETYTNLRNNFPNIKIGFALVSADVSKKYAITYNDLPLLRIAYSKLAELYIEEIKSGKSYNRFFESIVRNISNGYKKQYFCNCGNKYIAIGNDGAIYPCEGFLGYDEFILGNIKDNSVRCCNNSIENVDENMYCKKCWAKNLCGGSCYHECYMLHKNVNEKDSIMCETYKLALETGIRIYQYLDENSLLTKFNEIIEETIDDCVIPVLNYDNFVWLKDINTIFVSSNSTYNLLNIDDITNEILQMCNGEHTLKEIVTLLSINYGVDTQIIYNDVTKIIKKMKKLSVLYYTN